MRDLQGRPPGTVDFASPGPPRHPRTVVGSRANGSGAAVAPVTGSGQRGKSAPMGGPPPLGTNSRNRRRSISKTALVELCRPARVHQAHLVQNTTESAGSPLAALSQHVGRAAGLLELHRRRRDDRDLAPAGARPFCNTTVAAFPAFTSAGA